MTDLDLDAPLEPDLRPPAPQPTPERLRLAVGGRLHQAMEQPTRPQRRGWTLVAAALVLVLLGGAAFAATRLYDRRTPPASGPLGTLDVGRIDRAEADQELASCLRSAGSNIPQHATWTIRYARIQHLTASRFQVTGVLWAQAGRDLLECRSGTFSAALAPGLPDTGPGAGRDETAVLDQAVPTVRCGSEPAADPAVALLKVGPTVRTVRVRLVVDGQSRGWQTTGAEGGLASVPVTDPDDFSTLSRARSAAYEIQALDAQGQTVPITTLVDSSGLTTVHQELPTCADLAGTAEEPASTVDGQAECLRLVAAATGVQDERRRVLATFSRGGAFLAVVGQERSAVLCSLAPTRGVRDIGDVTTATVPSAGSVDRSPLAFSAVDRGARGATVWAGGRLGPDVAAIDYAFSGGPTVAAQTSDGWWVMSYTTGTPFLDGRPLEGLPSVEVEIASTSGARSVTRVAFPLATDCDPDLLLPHC